MNEPPVIAPMAAPTIPLRLAPGFWTALRGVWLLTWRSHSSWRGLGGSLLALLALPALAFISATPFGDRSRDIIGDPAHDFQRFAGNLARHDQPLSAQQSNDLAAVFNGEYTRAHGAWQTPGRNVAPADAAHRQVEQLNEWNRRLLDGGQGILEPGQWERFKTFQKNAVESRSRKATQVRWNAADAFYHLLVEFYFFLVLPLVCVRSCGALIRDELQADTLGFLTTRPAPRATLVVVKYISQTAWLMVLLLAQTALLFAAGASRNVPYLGGVLGIFLVAQFLAVPAWSALGLLLGLFTKRYIATALVYGFVVELGLGRIPSNINALSLMRHLKSLLANNAMLRERFEWTDQAVWIPALALLAGAGIFLGASAVLFTFREYHDSADMQK